MAALRFNVGDRVFIVNDTQDVNSNGSSVTILRVGPFWEEMDSGSRMCWDYETTVPATATLEDDPEEYQWFCMDDELSTVQTIS